MTTDSYVSTDSLIEYMAGLPYGQRRSALEKLRPTLPYDRRNKIEYLWPLWARPAQMEPDDPWRIWLLLAGRGFGKTRAGAEWVRARVESGLSRRIALVARTPHEVRDIMIQGDSGILAVCPPWNKPVWESSKRRLTWPNGAMAFAFSSYEPDQLRGPQFDASWCDELASWQYPRLTWDNLAFGLRLGAYPKCVVTTTPKPIELLRELTERNDVEITTGSSYDNKQNLPPGYIDAIAGRYEGTNTGLQEIYAQLLREADGALWKREWIDDNRIESAPDDGIYKKAVALDPAVTFNPNRSDETGIIVAGIGGGPGVKEHNRQYWVIEDASGVMTPDAWARRAVELAHKHEAEFITGETNQGGALIETVLRHAEGGRSVRFKGVHATLSKRARAEPVAALYEQGRVHHVGEFTHLEDQMCGWTPQSSNSPDRMDALVWALNGLTEHSRLSLWIYNYEDYLESTGQKYYPEDDPLSDQYWSGYTRSPGRIFMPRRR